jgi:uncharacterized membrane protein
MKYFLEKYIGINEILNLENMNINNIDVISSPMDQFEIKPFLGNFLGLNYTPIGLITNIFVYIGLVIFFVLLFYIYGNFKDSIKING